jgi:predicted nucleic acid-binding protein
LARGEGSPGREANYTSGRFFIDTNLLVYAYDASAGQKWELASAVISALWRHRTGIISTQVVQELFVALTHKVAEPISLKKAREIIADLLHWPLVVIDADTILRAVDVQVTYHLSFWDSLILQAAISSRADFLLSEDLQHGQVIESVTIRNPFLE